ncbi:LXG domain-containing protein [Metabacillus sp. GX 13764]|uniref:T7SS effector LXG polymorphic toxin n=1 Tax=Metabacillus kandeliae TaxID=2900151 RepID=UPI001E6280A5|nr:T7SS effector LXG polymorphic toxin [Metabacillus kandeliae]MCD7034523.1 LXG domain-containing protein [Metabacillus kandeliae]
MPKILEAESLLSSVQQRAKEYKQYQEQIENLDKQIQVLVTNGHFTGQGAESIKSFFSEHSSLIEEWKKFIQMKTAFINTIHDVLERYKLEDASVYGNFLEGSIPGGLRISQQLIDSQKSDLDAILNEIHDTLPLDSFSTDPFDQAIHSAEKERQDTMQALHHADSQLTSEYAKSEELERFIKSYLTELSGATAGGKGANPLHFNSKAFHQKDLFNQQITVNQNADAYLKKREEEAEKKHLAEIERLKAKLNPFISAEEYIKIADKIGYENLSWDQKLDYNTYKFNIGGKNGMKAAFTGMWDDVKNIFTHPMDTVNGIVYTAHHPVEVIKYAGKAIKDSFMKDVVYGDAESRGHWAGNMIGNVLPALLTEGTTGIGKAGLGVAKAGTKAGAIAAKEGAVAAKTAIRKGITAPKNKVPSIAKIAGSPAKSRIVVKRELVQSMQSKKIASIHQNNAPSRKVPLLQNGSKTKIDSIKKKVPVPSRKLQPALAAVNEGSFNVVDIDRLIEKDMSKINKINKSNKPTIKPKEPPIQGKYSLNSIRHLPSFNDKIETHLKKLDITIDKFHELRLKPVEELTLDEIKIMKEIRDSVPPVTKETLLQKTLPIQDVKNYISGSDPYTEIGGYVAKVEDLKDLIEYDDVIETLRLDYTISGGIRPFPVDGTSYGIIRFKSNYADDVEIPYGEKFGGTNKDGPPCTLNGFTAARNNNIVPEWKFADRELPVKGAELYIVEKGKEELVAIFDGDRFVSLEK